MSFDARISYVNGEFTPHKQASISIDDRSCQFADSIYEVFLVYEGIIVEHDWHMDRLLASAEAIDMILPRTSDEILSIITEVLKKNELQHGSLYLQITRGQAERSHSLVSSVAPGMIVVPKHLEPPSQYLSKTMSVMMHDDIRWKLRNIKSTSLLGGIVARLRAERSGFDDVFFVNELGFVTESVSANIFVVTINGTLLTHPEDGDILHGTVRRRLLDIARGQHFVCEERKISLQTLHEAREVFVTSSTAIICPVVRVDNNVIGDGNIGDVTRELYRHYLLYLRSI